MSYYPEMFINHKITSRVLLFFWNIKHVRTGTLLQNTREQQCGTALLV